MCSHIESAILLGAPSVSTSDAIGAVSLDHGALDSFPFPKDVRTTFEEMAKAQGYSRLIQQVSERSFVIRTEDKTFHAPQQLLHIRFDVQNNFHCQCSQYKRVALLSSSTTAPGLSRRCIHLYMFFWACLSNYTAAAHLLRAPQWIKW